MVRPAFLRPAGRWNTLNNHPPVCEKLFSWVFHIRKLVHSSMMDLFTFFDSIHKISAQAKGDLKQLVSEKTYSAQALVQEIGSKCKTIYFVQEGCARIFYYKNGKDITEHFAFENEMIVRAESLFTGKPTPKGIQAIADTKIMGLHSDALFKLFDKHQEIERLFRLIFEKEYVNTVKRIESFQFKSAKERYMELLETTDYVQKIPLKYIATYLGITQVSLSRIRATIS